MKRLHLSPLIMTLLLMTAFPSHAAPPEMLVITRESLADEARRLAALHSGYDGLKVEIVTVEGSATGGTIRQYVDEYRNGGVLRYLLLLGEDIAMDASDISLCGNGTDNNPFVIPDIAVGRIPASTPAEMADYIEKARAYIGSHSARSHNDIIIACDGGDGHEHLEYSEKIAVAMPGCTIHKVYLDLDRQSKGEAIISRQRLVRAMRSGSGLMTYTGHGHSGAITGRGLWDTQTALTTESTVMPLAFFSSCEINDFAAQGLSLGEAMVYNRRGGAMGVIAARKPVLSTYNLRITLSFIEQRSNATAGATTGSLWLATQQETMAAARRTMNRAYADNIAAYTLAGDPAMPLFVPEFTVVPGNIPESLTALDGTVVEGSVRDTDGNLCSSFNGVVEARLYAPPVTLATLGQHDVEETRDVIMDETLLWHGCADVSNGNFSLTVCSPAPEKSGTVRMTLHAVAATGAEAWGHVSGKMNFDAGVKGLSTDTTPPEIYVTSTSDLTDTDFTVKFTATACDNASGVMMSETSLAGKPLMTVDGLMGRDMTVTPQPDGGIELTASFGPLEKGTHALSVTVADNAGNRAVKEIPFTVTGNLPAINLTAESITGRENALLHWHHNLTAPVQLTLIATSLAGDTALHATPPDTGSFTWELSDVTPGIYRCTILATDGHNHVSSPSLTIYVTGSSPR